VIVFRTNASSHTGIGHLARSYRLAMALSRRGYSCLFVVDQLDPFTEEYIRPFEFVALYNNTELFVDEESDADLFAIKIGNKKPEAVITDDYRLSALWEARLEPKTKVIVLDDCDESLHVCSMLVDGKWTGNSTAQRYQNKVPERCVRLLGPHYLMLDDKLSEATAVSKGEAEQEEFPIELMVSFGGGGDLSIAASLIEQILQDAPHGLSFSIRPVVGYFGTNKDSIFSLAEKDNRVKPIIHKRSLADHMRQTTLYVGAAGGTLYEILSLNVPALTFSMSANQQNNLNDLGDIGHYFHLDSIERSSFAKLSELVWSMLSSISRIRRLYRKEKIIKIDGQGLERVSAAIDSLIKQSRLPMICYAERPYPNANNGTGYHLEQVEDKHINHYLDSRNLDLKMMNMPGANKIQRIDHFLWWLKSKRESYLLKKDGDPILYIWHQPRTIKGVTFLIGGWFVCSKSCGAVDALYALNRQLAITCEKYPELPWVAVIKKTNRYVQALNERLGFRIIPPGHLLHDLAKISFPNALPKDFLFYSKQGG